MDTLPAAPGAATNAVVDRQRMHARRRAGTPLAWIGVAAFLVFLFDPGIMTNDSIQTLRQGRAWEFTDWHPPIMAMIWRLLDRVIEGPAGMLMAQCMLYAFGCARLCAAALPGLMRRWPGWLVIASFSLFPPAMGLVGMIWKDVWMSGFLLLATSMLFSLAEEPPQRRAVLLATALAACCLLATAFRHNALAATAGLLAGAAYFLWRHRTPWVRLGGACVAGVLTALLLAAVASGFNGMVAKRVHVTTPLLLHDIAGMVVFSGDPAQAGALALADNAGLASDPARFVPRVLADYSPAAAGPLLYSSRNRDAAFAVNIYRADHDADAVRKTWRKLLARYPVAYLKHRWLGFSCLLQLCDRQRWVNRSYFLNPQYALPDTLSKQTWQWHARRILLSSRLAPLYAPVAWLLVAVVGLGVGLATLRRFDGRRASILFVSLSSLGLAVSLVFTSPIESYRYVHWCVMVGLLLTFMVLDRTAGTRDPPARP